MNFCCLAWRFLCLQISIKSRKVFRNFYSQKGFLTTPLQTKSSINSVCFFLSPFNHQEPLTCGPGFKKCTRIHSCIPEAYWCNGIVDCKDHSDEGFCRKSLKQKFMFCVSCCLSFKRLLFTQIPSSD